MSAPLTDQVLTWKTWRMSRMAFRRSMVLPDGRCLDAVMADFQRRDFEGMDLHQFSYLERPRGASKTTDLGLECVAELFLGPPNGRLIAAAVDRDQAALLHEAAVGWLRRTPALERSVITERWKLTVPATGTTLEVLAADAPSSWGKQPTWICCDEFAQWPEGSGEELWQSLWTASGKRNAKVVIITTPGWDRASLCWRVREMALASSAWYVGLLNEPAPWTDRAWLEEQRRTLPGHVFERLHLGRWVQGAGAFLTTAEVDAIFAEALPPGPGRVAIGLDLGWSRDRAAAAVVRHDQATGAVVIDRLLTWTPDRGGKIDLTAVEEDVLTLARAFGAPVIADQWEAKEMSQRLQQQGVRFVLSWASSLAEQRRQMFSTLLDLIRSGRLRARFHERLRHELLGLDVKESAAGWRVDHKPSQHDDTVIAVALATHEVAGGQVWTGSFADAAVLGPQRESVKGAFPRVGGSPDDADPHEQTWANSPWGG